MMAVRFGQWKAIQTWDSKKKQLSKLKVYNLDNDPSEKKDLSQKLPEITQTAQKFITQAWIEDPNYPLIKMKAIPRTHNK